MRSIGAGILLLAVLASAVFLLQLARTPTASKAADSADNSSVMGESKSSDDLTSIDAGSTVNPVTTTPAPPQQQPLAESQPAASDQRLGESIDVTQIGLTGLSDGDFNNVIAALRNDPDLRSQLLLEYRSNTDPKRAIRIAQILEEFDYPAIVTLGQEMAFSGEPDSQKAGLALLGGQQKGNPEARAVVLQVLDIETNPDVLVSAFNALAKPASIERTERKQILDRFTTHFTHPDPLVRRHSLNLMARWGDTENLNDYYVRGLNDADERVRTGALFSLIDTRFPDDSTKQALIDVIKNISESQLLRQNALNALKRYDISPEDQKHYLGLVSGE